jgi:hypothetical protein
MEDVQLWLQQQKEFITRLVESAPDLTEDQREKIRVLFAGSEGK